MSAAVRTSARSNPMFKSLPNCLFLSRVALISCLPGAASEFDIIVTRRIVGFRSLSSCIDLPTIAGSNTVKPVMLRLGLLKPSLKPDEIGSDTPRKTISMLVLLSARADVVTVLVDTRTSGARATRSAAIDGIKCACVPTTRLSRRMDLDPGARDARSGSRGGMPAESSSLQETPSES
jgi:hypothetical protein